MRRGGMSTDDQSEPGVEQHRQLAGKPRLYSNWASLRLRLERVAEVISIQGVKNLNHIIANSRLPCKGKGLWLGDKGQNLTSSAREKSQGSHSEIQILVLQILAVTFWLFKFCPLSLRLCSSDVARHCWHCFSSASNREMFTVIEASNEFSGDHCRARI